MTIPIHPVVVQHEGLGETAQKAFQPFVQALALNRQFKQQQQEFQLKMQEFQLEKFRTLKTAEMTDQQIAESKARQAESEQRMLDTQRTIAGQGAGQNAMNLMAMRAQTEGIEFGTPEWSALMRDARASLHDLDAKTANITDAHKVLDTYEDQLREAAIGASTVKVQEAQTRQAEANAAQARQQARLAGQQAVLELGQKVPLPLGAIGQQIGASVTPELQNIVLPSALGQGAGGGGSGGKESEQTLRARVFSTVMFPSAAMIKGLLEGGTRIRFVGSLEALMAGSPGFLGLSARTLANKFIPEDQRQYIAAARNYVAAWQYFSSGSQINEGEYFRLYRAIIPTLGDDDRTIAVKMSIIDTQLRAIEEIANGSFAGGPADGAVAALEGLQARGQAERWRADIRTSISEQLRYAREWQSRVRRDPSAMMLAPPDMIDQDGNITPMNMQPETMQSRLDSWGRVAENAFQSPSQLELPR